jgi:hypothetical protein
LKNFWKVQPELIVGASDYSQSADNQTAFVQIGDRTFGKKINIHLYMTWPKSGKSSPACLLYLPPG